MRPAKAWVSGETYCDYVRQHIFDPPGVRYSGYDETLSIAESHALVRDIEAAVSRIRAALAQ